MIDPTRIQFPRINKTFLKGLFWLGVFLFLATIFTSARGVYDIFLPKPEVRKDIVQLGDDVFHRDKIWFQRAIIIHNRGNDDAKNVSIKCFLPNGEITRLEIISDEDYSVSKPENGSEFCSCSLARLAAGSKIIILAWGTVSSTGRKSDQEAAMPIVSASYDGGIATKSDKLTALEEIEEVGNTLKRGANAIVQQLNRKTRADAILHQLTNVILPSLGIYFVSGPATTSADFGSALLATSMLMVTAWLLLPRAWAGLLIALFFSLLIWLFVDFWVVAIIWLSVPLFLGIFPLLTTRNYKEFILLIVYFISLLALLVTHSTATEWSCLFSNSFRIDACTLQTIHGGIPSGYIMFSLYFIFVEF